MAKINIDIEKLNEAQAKELLNNIVQQLDDLDCDDYFGTEGWRHLFGLED